MRSRSIHAVYAGITARHAFASGAIAGLALADSTMLTARAGRRRKGRLSTRRAHTKLS
jgi:hypothetical protein